MNIIYSKQAGLAPGGIVGLRGFSCGSAFATRDWVRSLRLVDNQTHCGSRGLICGIARSIGGWRLARKRTRNTREHALHSIPGMRGPCFLPIQHLHSKKKLKKIKKKFFFIFFLRHPSPRRGASSCLTFYQSNSHEKWPKTTKKNLMLNLSFLHDSQNDFPNS